MTAAAQPIVREHGNAYNIFILVLTVFSLGLMVLLLLPALSRAGRSGAGAGFASTARVLLSFHPHAARAAAPGWT